MFSRFRVRWVSFSSLSPPSLSPLGHRLVDLLFFNRDMGLLGADRGSLGCTLDRRCGPDDCCENEEMESRSVNRGWEKCSWQALGEGGGRVCRRGLRRRRLAHLAPVYWRCVAVPETGWRWVRGWINGRDGIMGTGGDDSNADFLALQRKGGGVSGAGRVAHREEEKKKKKKKEGY